MMNMETNEFLPYIIDVVCLAVLTGFFIYGWKQGFASRALRICSALLAIVITYLTFDKLAEVLSGAGLTKFIAEHLVLQNGQEGTDAGKLIFDLSIPTFIKEKMAENNVAEVYDILGASTVGEYVRFYLARIIVNAICIGVIFIVSLVLLNFLSKKLKKLNKLPLVGLVNEILGGAGSLLLGILLVSFVLFLVTALATPDGFLGPVAEALEKCKVTGFLQKINLFTGWAIRIR